MRIAAMAALLAVAHSSAQAAWSDGGGLGGTSRTGGGSGISGGGSSITNGFCAACWGRGSGGSIAGAVAGSIGGGTVTGPGGLRGGGV